MCEDTLDARPGPAVDGFLGGNIGGFVELGITGGYAHLPSHPNGSIAASVGIDEATLRSRLPVGVSLPKSSAFSTMEAADAQAIHAAPVLRIHFVPRGRIYAHVGAGFGYDLFRVDYATSEGDGRLDLHGIGVPIHGAFGVRVSKRVSIHARGQYRYTHHVVGVLENSSERLLAPIAVLDAMDGEDLRARLPHGWAATLAVRLTI